MVPQNGGLVNIEEDAIPLSFSWRQDPESESYIIKIADNPELKNPLIDYNISENYFTLKQKKDRKKIKEGRWYWSVTVQDSEGNISKPSEVRTFFAMKGKPEQHLIEPFDGYKSAESFVFDTKFTWKKNLPESFKSKIQIASDKDFINELYEFDVSGNSFSGVILKQGSYYWRLKSINTVDKTELTTQPRILNVVDSLESADLLNPKQRLIARENIPYKFSWSSVPDASYYKIMLYKKSNNELVHDDVVYGTEYRIDLYNNEKFIDKSMYRWEIQAHANAIPGISSRRTGKIAESDFYFVRLRPISIDFPPKNYDLKGEDAILKPITAKWSSVDELAYAQFTLRKVDEKSPIDVIKIPTDLELKNGYKVSPNKILLDTPDGLRPGDYEIIVFAETLDGINISNTDEPHIRKFSVLPIEPLEKAKNLKATPKSFDIEYLKTSNNPKTIKLTWEKVSKATEYHFEIIDQNRKSVLSETIKDKTSYVLDFASLSDEQKRVFSNGNFTWTVKGIRRIDIDGDGNLDKIFQEGAESKSSFNINIPTPKKAKAKGAVNPYGM